MILRTGTFVFGRDVSDMGGAGGTSMGMAPGPDPGPNPSLMTGGTTGTPAASPSAVADWTQAATPTPSNPNPGGSRLGDWFPSWAASDDGQTFINALLTNPTQQAPFRGVDPIDVSASHFGDQGSVPSPYTESYLAKLAAPAPAPVPVVETPKAEALDPNRPGFWNGIELGEQTWKDGMAFPQAGVSDWNSWMSANPHLNTAFEITDKGPIGTPGNSWYHKKGDPR